MQYKKVQVPSLTFSRSTTNIHSQQLIKLPIKKSTKNHKNTINQNEVDNNYKAINKQVQQHKSVKDQSIQQLSPISITQKDSWKVHSKNQSGNYSQLSTIFPQVHNQSIIFDSLKNEQQKSKRNETLLLLSYEDDHTSSIPSLINKKLLKHCQSTPYLENRKSYRKIILKNDKDYIPYRKTQYPIEGKIVNIINKILIEKNCQKDLIHLSQKIQKFTNKQLMNKYIISGIKVIVKLVEKQPQKYDMKTIQILQNLNKQLSQRIQCQLDNNNEYQQQTINKKQQDILDPNYIERFLIKKIYNLLKQKRLSYNTTKLQQQAIQISKNFLKQKQHNISRKNVIQLLKGIKIKY